LGSFGHRHRHCPGWLSHRRRCWCCLLHQHHRRQIRQIHHWRYQRYRRRLHKLLPRQRLRKTFLRRRFGLRLCRHPPSNQRHWTHHQNRLPMLKHHWCRLCRRHYLDQQFLFPMHPET
jgi:hypothetical protein